MFVKRYEQFLRVQKICKIISDITISLKFWIFLLKNEFSQIFQISLRLNCNSMPAPVYRSCVINVNDLSSYFSHIFKKEKDVHTLETDGRKCETQCDFVSHILDDSCVDLPSTRARSDSANRNSLKCVQTFIFGKMCIRETIVCIRQICIEDILSGRMRRKRTIAMERGNGNESWNARVPNSG